MKMLTVNKLALGNLKARKKRYILLIIGIVLSMVFSSGIMFFISTLETSLNEIAYNAYGTQDLILFGVDERGIEKLKETGLVSESTYAETLGMIYTDDENKGCVTAKFNDDAKEMYRICVKEGRLPTEKGEIAIEEDALVRLGLDISVGDSFECNFKISDGNEYLAERYKKTYTLVGVLSDKRTYFENYYDRTESFPAAVVSSNEKIDAGGKCRYVFFCNVIGKDADGSFGDSVSKIHNYCKAEYPDYNSTVTHWWFSGDVAGVSQITDTSALAITLAAVLMLASSIGIVNTFNSNLQDRKKQIGLLRAVGATRRQIIKVFGREAFIIALVCTPVSVLISYFATKIIISLMGELYVFKPKIWILAICAVAGLLCVMAAALIPLLRISRVSPMLAIRNTEYTRKLRKKHIKTNKNFDVPKLISKRENSFSKGRIIAVSIILTVSVLLGTLGFSWVQVEYRDYPLNYDYYLHGNFGLGFAYYGNNQRDTTGLNLNILNGILASPYVKGVRFEELRKVNWLIDEPTKMQQIYMCGDLYSFATEDLEENGFSDITPENYMQVLAKQKKKDEYGTSIDEQVQKKFGYGENVLNCNLLSEDEIVIEEAKKKVIDGKIDVDKLNSGEEIILCIPQEITYLTNVYKFDDYRMYDFSILDNSINYKSYGRQIEKQVVLSTAERDIHAGDEIELSLLMDTESSAEGYDIENTFEKSKEHRKTVKIGAIITPGEIGSETYAYDASFLTTHKGYESFGEMSRPTTAFVNLKKECDEKTDENLTALIQSLVSGRSVEVVSTFTSLQELDNSRKTMIIALISVILLFFTLCASLVNNAMSARIRENKRQIGTLRAVGASAKELTGSYIRQMISMFIYGTVGGFGIYNIVYLILFIWSKKTGNDMPVDYFVIPSVIMCAVVFAICSVNLWRQVKKQMKYSIVDNIREL